jgi:hypothetical protein
MLELTDRNRVTFPLIGQISGVIVFAIDTVRRIDGVEFPKQFQSPHTDPSS